MADARRCRPEDVKRTERDEMVFFDVKALAEKRAMNVENVYNITQLPPPSPDLTLGQIKRRNSKIKRVHQEEKKMSRQMEQRLQDISNIYRVAIPSMSDSYHRDSTRSSVSRLPPLSPTGGMISATHPQGQTRRTPANPELAKGSMFRATMAGRTRTSSSYREFVGRLSYLINQSREKMTKLYGNSNLSLVMEFLGKECPDHCVYLDSSPSDKMAAFRQQQFCISTTVRKILNNEAKKKRLSLLSSK
ncbi:uncharacterized protein LOC117333773 [Pecten maximus]|uniref:uncharacterized protein LOC117333773 n=1 Tax=Pecten maximus TaxID=6579 RepID=UPI00145910F3|nr:uncharacterized protein LOC117333773 [Pecten maximus]XP_033749088.1 uncharacterized protein LOC117333773 [Pecten maximus]